MSRSTGFTLVEVLVALLITGLVLAAGVRLVWTVGGAVDRLETHRESLDRAMNGQRWLAAAFLAMRSDEGGFHGDREELRFETRLEGPRGWWKPERVSLSRRAGSLIATLGSGESILLAPGVEKAEFDFLPTQGAGTHWVRTWGGGASVPYGIRIRVSRGGGGARESQVVDTMLFLTRRRG